ncbi:MAG: hypothetical protein F6J98_04755 [Moorea sp. SIO4G2]|uniref:hypothetical protein n=1 Tax=Moorena sp. SIO3I6 TaxID=2607831 RepID=UPI0013F9D4C7|nr:hypothetical protein [Moorena sp. SIO3I6]NEO59754.1 hypothetical protein [Moorena sp. SIO4G2]NEP23723.1 hypothetical protein [Moorena sp. SIO3I6]
MTQYFSDEIAERSSIQLTEEKKADVFLIPSTKEIILSQTNTAECINKPNRSIIEFSQGKSLEAIAYKRFGLSKKQKVKGSNKPIDVILPQQSFLYWNYWNRNGLKDAIKIVIACGIDSIVSRSYQAFGIDLSLEKRESLIQINAKLLEHSQRLEAENTDLRNNDACWAHLNKELKSQLKDLSYGLAEPDHLQAENARLLRILRQHGIDPYSPQNYI